MKAITRKTITRSFLAALPLFCVPLAFAQHQAFNINPDSSEVKFTLGGHDTTTGTFHVAKGIVNFDAASPTLSGLIDVSAGSGSTGNTTRDKKMSTQVLEAAKFSDVTFAPQTYTGTLAPTGDSTLQVTGVFTLHGAPHTLTVPMQIHIDGPRCTAKTHFVVPYVEWGLKDPSIFILKVAKQVDVDLNLVGFLAPAN
jgi:polyisoprenoid-binding protein YceI